MKRKLLWLGAALGLCAGVVIVCLCFRTRIDPASFEKIRAGMNPQDVEWIIGVPPGDYYTGPPCPGGLTGGHLRRSYGRPFKEHSVTGMAAEDYSPQWWERNKGAFFREWAGNYWTIGVLFDESERAIHWSLWKVRVEDIAKLQKMPGKK